MRLLIVLLLLGSLSACSLGSGAVGRDNYQEVVNLKHDAPKVYREVLKNPGTGKSYPPFPIRYEEEVDRFVAFYGNDGRPYVTESLLQNRHYGSLLRAIFSHYRLPPELINVVAIESKFIPDAQSSSGAFGLWQFMPATARDEGLEVTYFSDERGDVVKSTIAAARYFQKLYDIFGDWYLALAAYNGGMGTITRAVQRAGSRDIFTILRSGQLCGETANYVPKILAFTLIMKNLDLYGFLPKEVIHAKS